MKQLSVISVSVLAMLLLSTSVMAWSNCKTPRCNADCNQTQQRNHIERMAVILDLNAEQQQQMAELRAAHQQKRMQMRTDLREARQQVRTAQPGATLDVEDLKAKARTYADLKAAMLVNNIEHKQQMFALLTAEQQEKAGKLKALKQQQRWDRGNQDTDNCSLSPNKRCRPQTMERKGACADRTPQNPCMKSRCR